MSAKKYMTNRMVKEELERMRDVDAGFPDMVQKSQDEALQELQATEAEQHVQHIKAIFEMNQRIQSLEQALNEMEAQKNETLHLFDEHELDTLTQKTTACISGIPSLGLDELVFIDVATFSKKNHQRVRQQAIATTSMSMWVRCFIDARWGAWHQVDLKGFTDGAAA